MSISPYPKVYFMHLNISNINFLTSCTVQEMVKKLHGILENHDTLDISGSELSKLETAKMVRFLSVIPSHVTVLNMSECGLGSSWDKENIDKLKKIFSAIPKHITSLDISKNNIGIFKTADDLDAIMSAIPKTVIKINVSSNDLLLFKDIAHRDKVLQSLKSKDEKTERELIVKNNGEHAFARCLLPILSGVKQKIIPYDIACLILSFLVSPEANVKSEIKKIPTKILQSHYKLSGGSFFQSRGIFLKASRDEVITTLQERANKDPNGASSQTLTHFCIR